MVKGYFISIEGGEGAGKSTLLRGLAKKLDHLSIELVLTREPGGTDLGLRLRRELLEGRGIVPLAELLLYEADRAQHVAEVIAPALGRGAVVLCDRYSDSTLAYQGYGRGLDRRQVALLNAVAEQSVRPNLTLWLDVPVEEGLLRARGRGLVDRLETETFAFHERVRKGFRSLARREPHRFIRIDGRAPADVVLEKAWEILYSRLRRRYDL